MNFRVDLSENQQLNLDSGYGHQIWIKREDLIHPYISGNKYRKLLYNLAQAKAENQAILLTFGGAFSNHIAAVAAAGKEFNFKTIGVIRGEELVDKISHNPTLKFAKDCGMVLKFVTRSEYKQKSTQGFLQKLKNEFGDFYLIPEGGTNDLAIKGCEEIFSETDADFDFICCAVGTGGTISGLINSSQPDQTVLGFPAIKGDFLPEEISKFARNLNWKLITSYHFGGYAKINPELIGFINQFKYDHNVPLDPIYTGKMMYGVMDLLKNGYFPENSRILVVHTGGLQGIVGMNSLLKKKKWPLIN